MNLKIPKKDPSELMLYLWKIFDLPQISEKDLLYLISFELLLVSPEQALKLIQNSLKKNILIKNSDTTISLNKELQNKLSTWQKKRKNKIIKNEKMNAERQATLIKFKKESKSDFNVVLKAFLDKGTINRAVTVSEDAFNFLIVDLDKRMIEATVSGSKKKPYIIQIDMNNKTLKHDCHDFITRRSKNKKFCKHLTKFFLILKDKNEDLAIKVLNTIADSIPNWEFTE
jgi:hypothetical protein